MNSSVLSVNFKISNRCISPVYTRHHCFPLIGRKRLAIADEVFVLKRRVLHKANMKRIVNCELMNCTEIRTVKFSLLNSEETSPSGKQNCSMEHVQRDMLIRCFSPRVCMFACLYNFHEPGVSEMNTWSGVSSPWSQPAYLDFSRNIYDQPLLTYFLLSVDQSV